MACAAHEKKFGTEKSDTHCASVKRTSTILRQFDIGQQMNVRSIACDGRGLAQLAELFSFANKLILTLAILLKHDGRRIDNDNAGITINDEPVVFGNQRRRIRHTHCRRYIETAGDNGSVRVLTTKISDKTNKGAITELQHVSRRNIVSDDDHLSAGLTAVRRCGQRAGAASQSLEYALTYLQNVILAFTQIGIFNFVKLRGQLINLREQRPLGVVMAAANDLERMFGNDRVGQNQRVYINESGQLGRRIGRQIAPHCLQLLIDGIDRFGEASDFGFDFFFRHQIMLDVPCRRPEQVRAANRNATRYRNAMQSEGSHQIVNSKFIGAHCLANRYSSIRSRQSAPRSAAPARQNKPVHRGHQPLA